MPKLIEMPNRVKLQYFEQGDPGGVPVILLHGATDSWRSFEPVLPYLPESTHVYALTQRGHGDSDKPQTGYRTRDFARDVAAFMDAVGLEQALVVGHSMGSANALRFAIDYPQRTLGLLLAGAFARFRDSAAIVEFSETAIAQLSDPIDPAFVRDFQQSTLARPVPAAFFEMVVRESLKVPAQVWRSLFEGLLEDDFVDDLGLIRAPTLVVWGTHDALYSRADQDALLAAIAGARLVVYEGGGHAVHWEEPKRFAIDAMTFAKQLAVTHRRR